MLAVMATSNSNFIRVRLHFDYPPPSVIDCRVCWLLVDLNKCRVVADLEGIIREKFEFSRRTILNLFIEDSYLPHTESIYVVRDNDSVRVKVDCLSLINLRSCQPDTASENCKKRQRPTREDVPGENGVSLERKKKKGRKEYKESCYRDAKLPSYNGRNEESQGKCSEKKKKKKAGNSVPIVTIKPTASTEKIPINVDQPVKSNKKLPVAQENTLNVSSDSSSSRSEEEAEAHKKIVVQKPATKVSTSTPVTSGALPATLPTRKKPKPFSSISETVSTSDENTNKKKTLKTKPLTSTSPKGRISYKSKPQHSPSAMQSTVCAQKQATSIAVPQHNITKPCASNSREKIKLMAGQPVNPCGHDVGSRSSWKGCGYVKDRHGGPGEREWVKIEAENAPKQDYSSMPLLAAPPPVGQRIVFKLLELSENYTPEISKYKEGKIVSFDDTTNEIELELHNASQAPVVPGKFDLIYLNPDGSERVEYAVSRGSRVTERWDSLLEPRLII